MYKNFFKPIFDFTVALVGLIILSPIFLIITILLFVSYKGKVFFTQSRPGYKERPIKILKFKTMSDECDENGELLPNHMRITKFGKFLRRSSLDEIPQLINVLKGDMSLVGPRPLLFKYIPLYSAEQRRRHDVKPGITGLAQISGRNSITWTKKFKHDVFYTDNVSFLLDLKIFRLTFMKVVKGDGVNAGESVTSEPFNGHN